MERLLLLLLVSLTVALAANRCCGTPLPAPVDTPRGPEGVEPPGAVKVPAIEGKALPGAPAIAAWSETTRSNETLIATGVGLDGATLKAWAGGEDVIDIRPLRTAHDRLAAVVPADAPAATMLIWPVRGGAVGAPIRVNGSTAWWVWPARALTGRTGRTVRLFGRNLAVDGGTPRVYLKGDDGGRWLEVVGSNPWHVEARLPDDLPRGEYWVWAHNGTGGRFGWSEPMTFEVTPGHPVKNLPVVRVDDFGATPDDGADDSAAIQRAFAEAAEHCHDGEGCEVRFSAGTYRLARPVATPDWAPRGGVRLVGAGRGDYDAKTNAFSGQATVISVMSEGLLPPVMIRLQTPGSSVRDLNVAMAGLDNKFRKGLAVTARDVRIVDSRFVCVDRRPDKPERQIGLNQAPLYLNTPGSANIEIERCEFVSPAYGVQIGEQPPPHWVDELCPPSTNDVRIAHCRFVGAYRGPLIDVEEGHPKPGPTGAHSRGVCNYNGKRLIVEKCRFEGLDRKNGLILGRMIRNGNSSIRNVYFAENTGENVGPHESVKYMDPHMGELILFHLMYPHGGIFDVTEAGRTSVTVATGDENETLPFSTSLLVNDSSGSRIVDDVARNDHWIAFVCAGRGVGQFRVVDGKQRMPGKTVLRLRTPWRIEPDETSRIALQAMYRQNIVYGNTVNGDVEPGAKYKIAGVLFWYNAVDNIVAANRFRGVNWGGVVLDAIYRHPVAWNLVRDNRFEDVRPWVNERYSRGATIVFYQISSDKGWPPGPERVWYAVGNQFRGNTGTNCYAAAEARWLNYGPARPSEAHDTETGLMLTAIEHNRFDGLTWGLRLGPPACWTVVRENALKLNDPDRPAVQTIDVGKMADPTTIQ